QQDFAEGDEAGHVRSGSALAAAGARFKPPCARYVKLARVGVYAELLAVQRARERLGHSAARRGLRLTAAICLPARRLSAFRLAALRWPALRRAARSVAPALAGILVAHALRGVVEPHRQRDALSRLVNLEHLDLDDVTGLHDL